MYCRASSFADGMLEGITDPVLMVRVKLLLAENAALRGQLLAARHLANQVSVLDLSHDSSEPKPVQEKFHLTVLKAMFMDAL